MKIIRTQTNAVRRLLIPAALSAAVLAVTGCGGGVGSGSSANAGAGSGYAVDAPDEERSAALEELEPVTLTFQPSGQSENSNAAVSAIQFAEEVERISDGKITVDIVWAQAIASYSEVNDALADGRLDLAFSIPAYDPQAFTAINDLGTLLAEAPQSPNMGVVAANAAAVEIAWSSDTVMQEYEAAGVIPIQPVIASGHYYPTCNNEGSLAEGLKGSQVRTASSAQTEQLQQLGAAPVSMEYVEAFEALQRGTVDCALNQLAASLESGLFEVAPHIQYGVEHGYAFSPSSVLAGASFEELPLAYQQVIFDAWPAMFAGNLTSLTSGAASSVEAIKASGGTVTKMPGETELKLAEAAAELAHAANDAGRLGDESRGAVKDSLERWEGEAGEVGIADGGTLEDMDEWYDDDQPFLELADILYADIVSAHRPG